MTTYHVTIKKVKASLLDRVKQIAENPAAEGPDLQKQVAILATAVTEVVTYCDSLLETVETLSKHVKLTK
jgi:hypothetical protein